MIIITHRGLNPSKEKYFVESSLEAFTDQLERGYGLEFDLQVTKDGKIVIIHDSNLKRISSGKDERKIREVTVEEILSMEFDGCHLTTLDVILDLIYKKQTPGAMSAIHMKYGSQNTADIDTILPYFKGLEKNDYEKFIVFDVKLETAQYLKEKNPHLHLAPSVAHPYDIECYNNLVGGTLMTLDEALAHPELFDWVWLDEWDLMDANGGKKILYSKEVFDRVHEKGMRAALVTPELHASSPGLLGREAHPDATNKKILFKRIEEIIYASADALCTDYPDEVKNIKITDEKY